MILADDDILPSVCYTKLKVKYLALNWISKLIHYVKPISNDKSNIRPVLFTDSITETVSDRESCKRSLPKCDTVITPRRQFTPLSNLLFISRVSFYKNKNTSGRVFLKFTKILSNSFY